jgi:hypothetical protein
VNSDSPRVTAADMQPLYAAGWDDEALYFAITVCALFYFYNRWIDATGVHALSPEAQKKAARGQLYTVTSGIDRALPKSWPDDGR